MANGYVGKLLFVDLTSGAITEETRDDAFYRKWIGGAGLAAATILERTEPGIDPLGPENMLAFATGPLTGTGVYGGGRYTVACKSPLTGAWADSNSGGTWGPELKFAGYDGLFVTGAAAGAGLHRHRQGQGEHRPGRRRLGARHLRHRRRAQREAGRTRLLDHHLHRPGRREAGALGRHRQREGPHRRPLRRGRRHGVQEAQGRGRARQGRPHRRWRTRKG